MSVRPGQEGGRWRFWTPDQKPFFVGTYFPKHRRYGHPGLLEILQEIDLLWDRKSDRGREGDHRSYIRPGAIRQDGNLRKSILERAVASYIRDI